MFRRGLKELKTRPFAEVCSFLLRNFSGNSRRKLKFVKRETVAPRSNIFNWPTLQRIPNDKDVDEKDEKRYSTFKVENSRAQEMWQKARIGAREQNSLRGYQPANSDVTSDSEEIISALDKVRRIEERRKIQNKMQTLMQEQEKLDKQIQDEQDRVAPRKEVLVEREPAKQDPPREYAPVRNPDSFRSGPWISATVLAATGNSQQLRYTPKPFRTHSQSGQAVSPPQSSSLPEKSASRQPEHKLDEASANKAQSEIQAFAKSVVELHKSRAEEMDKLRSENEYSKDSACLKMCDHSVFGKRGKR
ncbi:uncharacterized protein LOC108049828 isoform X2 [Drosophila rhopaloa]|uniref:Uncharacterized protein LOC108049828 isoform X2 n=1 Tax=Drosophila rhopaloa TaxID=1041015 RepID=A0A6P4FH23_DRORH|nr:uncharacterized protein LOC108049828 isoform X2 [Drosophila rhopaloa]